MAAKPKTSRPVTPKVSQPTITTLQDAQAYLDQVQAVLKKYPAAREYLALRRKWCEALNNVEAARTDLEAHTVKAAYWHAKFKALEAQLPTEAIALLT